MHNLQQTESCPKFTSAIHTISDWAKYESDLCLQIYSWHLQWVSPGTWLHESSRHRYTCKHIIGYQDPLYWIWCINRNNWICKWQFQGSVHMMDSTLERFVKQLWNIVAHPCLWLSSILVDPGVVLKHRRYYSLHGKTLPDPFLCGLLCSTFYCQVLQFPREKNCCKCDDMQQLSFGFVLFINKVSSSIYVLPGCHNKSWTSHLSLDLNNYSFSQIHRSPRKEGHRRGKIYEVIYMPWYLHYLNLIFNYNYT